MEASDKESLLQRAGIYLQYEDWADAAWYADKALRADPESGEAYLIKAQAFCQVRRPEELKNSAKLVRSRDFQSAVRLAQQEDRARYEAWLAESEIVAKEKAAAKNKRRRLLLILGAAILLTAGTMILIDRVKH